MKDLESKLDKLSMEVSKLQEQIINGVDELQMKEMMKQLLNDKMIDAVAKIENLTKGDPKKQNKLQGLNTKEAGRYLPNPYGASSDNSFKEFKHELKAWASILHPDAQKWIEEAEAQKTMINGDEFVKARGDDAKAVGVQLYLVLSNKCRNSPKITVMAAQSPNGFKAWNDLARELDPRTGSSETSALQNLQIPPKRAQTEHEFIEIWRKWENDVVDYEIKFGAIKEKTKIVAVNAIMPVKMQEHARLACINFDKYAEMKTLFSTTSATPQ